MHKNGEFASHGPSTTARGRNFSNLTLDDEDAPDDRDLSPNVSEPKVRNVFFHMTHPESSPRDAVHSLFRWPSMKFAVIGYDNATDTLEGYLEFTCSLRFSTVQHRLPEAQVYLRMTLSLTLSFDSEALISARRSEPSHVKGIAMI